MQEGTKLLQMATCGVSDVVMSEEMQEWPSDKKAQGWQLIAEYFRNCADFNPEIETGKAIARLNMLLQNSVTIQDYKTCLAIQKELNKLLSLYA